MNLHPTVSVDGITGYHLVHEGTLEAKDAEITRLKAENAKAKEDIQRLRDAVVSPDKWKAKFHEAYNENVSLRNLVGKLEHTLQSLQTRIVNTDGRDNELRIALNAAKKENKHLRRLLNTRGQYSSGDIESFDEKTPDSLADLVEFEIGCGARTTFAAACLILMQRRYKDVARKNSILAERNGKLANAIKAAAQAVVTN
jgi:hypothetical protein